MAVWFSVIIATGRAPRAPARRRTWWLPLLLFAVGSLVDAALAPTGTLIGPALVAVWLAATASRRTERAVFTGAAVAYVGLTFGSLTGIPGLATALPAYDDSVARSAALGALLILAGLAALVGAENSVTSCDLHILVYEAAEPVSS